MEITKSKSINIVCRLGGFHLLISFLESIGKAVECSGISELFQVVYSSATAVHMLSGKVHARALQAHFLEYSALELVILLCILPLSLIEQLLTYDVDRNISVILVTQMMSSFRMKYQSMLMKMTLRYFIHYLSKLSKTSKQQ